MTSTSSFGGTERGAYGPYLFAPQHPGDGARGLEPGSELPVGLVALYDGRGRNETPLWLPEQRALVFADALTERRPAARLGHPARGARPPRASSAARAAVRAPDRLARRARARTCGVRARARTAAPGWASLAGASGGGAWTSPLPSAPSVQAAGRARPASARPRRPDPDQPAAPAPRASPRRGG